MSYDFDTYYWQDGKIRLRLRRPSDSEQNYLMQFDSLGISLVGEEMPLPPVKPVIKPDSEQEQPNNTAPEFIIETLSGEYVGGLHFNFINERHGTFSIGMILLKQYRNKGYGKAAMRILFEYAFNERRLHKFTGFCLDDNIASAKMMESLGCVREGTIRDVIFLGGKYHSQYIFGITEEEYNKNRK